MFRLTYGYGPHSDDLQEGLGSGVEAAVVDGVLDGDVAVQGDGAEVHNGGGGEEDVQVNPDCAELARQRPPVPCGAQVQHQQGASCFLWQACDLYPGTTWSSQVRDRHW